jgi:lysophospholipase L1-like esterase
MKQAIKDSRPRIVGLGDSTTAGTPGFKSPLEAPPFGEGDETSQYAYWLMRAHPAWEVLNRGINGERSDQIRARFARDVLEERARSPRGPFLVVILAGVNDIYQGRGAEAVQQELEAMYGASASAGIPAVAATILPYNTATPDAIARMRAVNDWIREYARTHRRELAFCDTRAAVSAENRPDQLDTSPDGLHPSPDGYRRMALSLEPVIEARLADMDTTSKKPEALR